MVQLGRYAVAVLTLTGGFSFLRRRSNRRQQRANALTISTMPQYVIEREIPGAGNLTAEQLKAISQASCGVLDNLGPQIQWDHSYVTTDKVYCVYSAPNEGLIREHARQSSFPANAISQVANIISPSTAEHPPARPRPLVPGAFCPTFTLSDGSPHRGARRKKGDEESPGNAEHPAS